MPISVRLPLRIFVSQSSSCASARTRPTLSAPVPPPSGDEDGSGLLTGSSGLLGARLSRARGSLRWTKVWAVGLEGSLGAFLGLLAGWASLHLVSFGSLAGWLGFLAWLIGSLYDDS